MHAQDLEFKSEGPGDLRLQPREEGGGHKDRGKPEAEIRLSGPVLVTKVTKLPAGLSCRVWVSLGRTQVAELPFHCLFHSVSQTWPLPICTLAPGAASCAGSGAREGVVLESPSPGYGARLCCLLCLGHWSHRSFRLSESLQN